MAEKNYTHRDVDMLIATRTLLAHCQEHKAELVDARPGWADPYFGDLRLRVDTAIDDYLGIDAAKELRASTIEILELMKAAHRKLSLLKVQLEVDYASESARLTELLAMLGYSTHWESARRGDQEAAIQLLYQYKENLTADMKAEFIAKGMSPTLLSELDSLSEELRETNVKQETLKSTRKDITAEARAEFNAIYEAAIGISKIAVRIFQDDAEKQQKFVFSRIVDNLNI